MEAFRGDVNGGYTYEGEYIKLTADIDMSATYNSTSAKSWTPIGSSANSFDGTFDGDGYGIKGLYTYLSAENKSYQGLFGKISGAAVKNLTVYGSVRGLTYLGYSGGVVGEASQSVIKCCCNKVNVTSAATSRGGYIGGVVGYATETAIKNCCNVGDISGYAFIGGIVGRLVNSSVKSSCSAGTVTAKGKETNIGGAVGNASSSTAEAVYYLDGGTSFDSTIGTAKTADEFKFGLVAYLLQSVQTDKAVQTWGQHLTNTAAEGETSNKDDYPVLTSASDSKVNKITFMTAASTRDNPYAVRCANQSLAEDRFPAAPTADNYRFLKWSTTKSADGEAFTAESTVTADMTVYAVGNEATKAAAASDTFELHKNVPIASGEEIDLKKLVANKSGAGG